MKAFQEGVARNDRKGKPRHYQGFNQGYFPVSRLISTFPSASDVAWSEILGNEPLPGYQRTYFDLAANRQVFVNAVTSSAAYEEQMTWRLRNRFYFAMSYVHPLTIYRYEVRRMTEEFLNTTSTNENYYALILSSDSALHMAVDVFTMLGFLDERIEDLRTRYKAREGRDLEILILSDHGNNHAGRGQRVQIKAVLKKAGYRIRKSIRDSKDVILPTAGIESWVEIHNAPTETERLMKLLSHLKGVDVLTAKSPEQPNQFWVMNSKGDRAGIEWNPERDSFRYVPDAGDPLEYLPVAKTLREKGRLDSAGFASSDAWMAATLSQKYPVALERIVRGHTHTVLNPATILISLANDHVHASWLVNAGSKLKRFGGTHGGLDDLNSTGLLLSNFAPTPDTTSSRVAALFDGFPGRNDCHGEKHHLKQSANSDAR